MQRWGRAMKKVKRKKQSKMLRKQMRKHQEMGERGYFSGAPKLAAVTGGVDGVPVRGKRI
jgi:hypothetical protein